MEKNLKKNTYIYKWIILLYNWNQHNTVYQLYFNKKLLVLKKKKLTWKGTGPKIAKTILTMKKKVEGITPTTSIKHCTGGSSQCNKAKKKLKPSGLERKG